MVEAGGNSGSAGTGGSAGSSNGGTESVPPDSKVVILGGGLCSFQRPVGYSAGEFAFVLALMASRMLRRRRRSV
jgi:hypothetical protein